MKYFFILILITTAISCKENYTPKPKGYPRTAFPEKRYQSYQGDCPYSFEYPVYAKIEEDNDKGAQPCWFNILYIPFNARLHLSYKPVTSKEKLYELQEDAHELVYKHTIKADAINENLIKTDNNVYGILYELEGNTATVLQFYVTDKTHHYLRGALYFNVKTNRDSLDPMINFLRADIKRMINTLKWRDTKN